MLLHWSVVLGSRYVAHGIAAPVLPHMYDNAQGYAQCRQLYTHHQCLPRQTPDTVMRVNGVGQQGAQTRCSAADVAAPGRPRYMRRHTALHSRSGLTARWHEQVIRVILYNDPLTF